MCTELAEERVQWRAFMNKVMNIHDDALKSWISWSVKQLLIITEDTLVTRKRRREEIMNLTFSTCINQTIWNSYSYSCLCQEISSYAQETRTPTTWHTRIQSHDKLVAARGGSLTDCRENRHYQEAQNRFKFSPVINWSHGYSILWSLFFNSH
jgi:hypothetical protein